MRKLSIGFLFVVGCLLSAGTAHAFVIDGNLSDWGVTPGIYGASDWVPFSGIASTVEDQDPGVNFLNPGYGGQLFDAEAMYASVDGTNLYYAIVTGHPPTGALGLLPGDIAFDFGSDGSFEYGIETISSRGYTPGSLYAVSSWNKGYWNTTDPTSMATTTGLAGSGPLVYNGTFYSLGSHYVLEGEIPVSAFGADWNRGSVNISWTETCGNDVVSLKLPTATPEPATMALFGVGLAGMGLMRRKKGNV